jgi:hypothetical protein
MIYRKWTQEEIDYLKENYGKILVKNMIKKLNKTLSSIRAKANELNLKSNIPNSKETHRKIALNFTKQLKNSAYYPSKELAYIIGVLNGDGYISKTNKCYFFRLAVKDKDFADFMKKTLYLWSGIKPCFYKRKDKYYKQGFYYEIFLNSKNVYQFLYDFSINKNPQAIENIKKFLKNKKYKVKFIEGFFDSEGSITEDGRINITNINQNLLILCKEFLENLGINTDIIKKIVKERKIRDKILKPTEIYSLCIKYKEEIQKFCEICSSTIERKNKNIQQNFIRKPNVNFYFEIINDDNKDIFNEIIKKYHSYKSSTKIVGKRINYIIRNKETKEIYGVIGVSNSFLYQGTRDRYIGWNKEQRLKNICKIVNNWRFCLLPNVPKNLASQILAFLRYKAKIDWKEKYNQDIVLIETYVSENQRGSSYKADNWQYIGNTKGYIIGFKNNKRSLISKKGEIKKIFITPLSKNWREELLK